MAALLHSTHLMVACYSSQRRVSKLAANDNNQPASLKEGAKHTVKVYYESLLVCDAVQLITKASNKCQ